jgi:endonuclease-3
MPVPSTEQNVITSVLLRLLETFGHPSWRVPLRPVDELVSTILSQNTNDRNRDKAFDTLTATYSDWDQVRLAPEAEIIASIRVAGLANQKGTRIKAVLNEIYNERGNLDLTFLAELPREDVRQWLLKFKGVGRKTAAIVMQFALGIPAFPVDTHIYRVTGRLGARPIKMNVEQTHDLLEASVDPNLYYAGHLNLIRLGREICHPAKPECARCPVNDLCEFNLQATHTSN